MRFAIIAFMLFFAWCAPPALAQGNEYDVAKARWGMTMDEVRAEDAKNWDPVFYTTMLTYKDIILDNKVTVSYDFISISEGLWNVTYFFNKIIESQKIFELLAEHLAEKYKEVPFTAIPKFKAKGRQFETPRTNISLLLREDEADTSDRKSVFLRYFDNTNGKAWEQEEARRKKEAITKEEEAAKTTQERAKKDLQQF